MLPGRRIQSDDAGVQRLEGCGVRIEVVLWLSVVIVDQLTGAFKRCRYGFSFPRSGRLAVVEQVLTCRFDVYDVFSRYRHDGEGRQVGLL